MDYNSNKEARHRYVIPMGFYTNKEARLTSYVVQWFHGLVVRTLDFESSNPISSLGGTFSTRKVRLDHLFFYRESMFFGKMLKFII